MRRCWNRRSGAVWGRVVGWQPLRLMHAGRTFKHYERILNVKFKEELEPTTNESERMNGYWLAKKVGRFWQAVTSGLVSGREAAIVNKSSVT